MVRIQSHSQKVFTLELTVQVLVGAIFGEDSPGNQELRQAGINFFFVLVCGTIGYDNGRLPTGDSFGRL
ncbi:MAG: hypothetical protein JO076_15620 [Verrucomicrobia bacterium]|nr:hypothetical protein [Verrucomicrobiota bacterium]